MSKSIYMDYSATTPVKKEVLDAMLPYFTEHFGNPSSIHAYGREVKNAVNRSRETIAGFINAKTEEVYFTGGGSESDNWAIKGIAHSYRDKGNHIITTTIEHHAVLHTCETLQKEGFDVTYLKVDSDGRVNLEELEAAITDKTILISIMFVNNEIGTIQPIKEIGAIARKHKVFFHTDAVQAIGNIKIDVEDMNIDLLAGSAHKVYGPKGIGMAYIRKGIKIQNLIDGGAQERKRRAGTENVAGIVGFGKAIEIAAREFDDHVAHSMLLRDKMIKAVMENIPYTRLNGHPVHRHPGNANFCFEFIEGESLLLSLDMVGIAGSSGSACTSGSLDPSHVLMAIGLPHEIAHGSLRLSMGDFNTEEDVDYAVNQLITIVQRLRSYSPLYEKVKGGRE